MNDTLHAPYEEDIGLYLQQIRQYPLLTAQQEKELAKACAAGDPEAVKTMVNCNLRLVVSIAREYAGRGVPMLDLIQEGSISLLTAASKFDHTLENRFSTYATKCIRGGMLRCVMNHGDLIRIPERAGERIRKVRLARNALWQELHREPADWEIAQACDMEEDKVRQTLELIHEVCSLDSPAGEDDTLRELLEDTYSPQPQEELVRQELKNILEALLQKLTQRQQQVLRLRFGLEDGTCYSLDIIGAKLGISRQRAREVEKEAVQKLKKLSAGLDLEAFLTDD